MGQQQTLQPQQRRQQQLVKRQNLKAASLEGAGAVGAAVGVGVGRGVAGAGAGAGAGGPRQQRRRQQQQVHSSRRSQARAQAMRSRPPLCDPLGPLQAVRRVPPPTSLRTVAVQTRSTALHLPVAPRSSPRLLLALRQQQKQQQRVQTQPQAPALAGVEGGAGVGVGVGAGAEDAERKGTLLCRQGEAMLVLQLVPKMALLLVLLMLRGLVRVRASAHQAAGALGVGDLAAAGVGAEVGAEAGAERQRVSRRLTQTWRQRTTMTRTSSMEQQQQQERSVVPQARCQPPSARSRTVLRQQQQWQQPQQLRRGLLIANPRLQRLPKEQQQLKAPMQQQPVQALMTEGLALQQQRLLLHAGHQPQLQMHPRAL
jgi:hypothetical protein